MINILHAGGGRITAITGIGHDVQRACPLFFLCQVEWDDGGHQRAPDHQYQVNPSMLKSGDRADIDKALGAMDEYLRINGEWVNGQWAPHAPSGHAEFNL
jgi:hypothetical protein